MKDWLEFIYTNKIELMLCFFVLILIAFFVWVLIGDTTFTDHKE